MEISYQKSDDNKGVVTLQLSPADYEKDFSKRLSTFAKNHVLKGFRTNTPAHLLMVKRRHGKAVLQEIVLSKAKEEVLKYIETQNFFLIGNPVIDEQKITWKEGETFTLVCAIDVVPDFVLAIDKTLKVDQYQITSVSEQEIENTIEVLRRTTGQFENISSLRVGSIIWGTIEGEEGKEESVHLEINQALFDAVNGAGKCLGDTLSIAPALIKGSKLNCHALLQAKAEQATEAFLFTIGKILFITPSPLTQPFFEKIFKGQEVRSLEAFKMHLEKQLMERAQVRADQLVENQLRTLLLERATITLPKNYAKKKELSWEVILTKLSKAYKVEVNQQQVVKLLAARYQMAHQGLQNIEALKAHIQKIMENPDQEHFRSATAKVFENNVLAHVKTRVTLVKKDLSFSAFSALEKEVTPTAPL